MLTEVINKSWTVQCGCRVFVTNALCNASMSLHAVVFHAYASVITVIKESLVGRTVNLGNTTPTLNPLWWCYSNTSGKLLQKENICQCTCFIFQPQTMALEEKQGSSEGCWRVPLFVVLVSGEPFCRTIPFFSNTFLYHQLSYRRYGLFLQGYKLSLHAEIKSQSTALLYCLSVGRRKAFLWEERYCVACEMDNMGRGR